MREVAAVIRDEIARYGVISVARFMELALYHSDFGYYRQRRSPFGQAGDFYTAEQLQPIFGELMASYAAKLQFSAESDGAFSILELGAGAGDMRSALSDWNYRGFDWTEASLPASISGLVLANEFFDALPVHLLVKNKNGWQEIGVRVFNGALSLIVMMPAGDALLEYAHRYGASIQEGGRLEVGLDAEGWFEKLSHMHVAGRLLIIDYGYSAAELGRLTEGTMMTYQRHHASADFLSDPGERDITAHVNFSYLKEVAVKYGYRVEADHSLSTWMSRVWSEDNLGARWKEKDQRWKLQWKQLFFGMGETFHVLELRKEPRNG